MKAFVFQARSALVADRRAREIACIEIREHLATATAGELRRGTMRRHLRQCEDCAAFRADVRDQRRLLAIALPVVPSLGLKESALAAAGVGGGGAAGGGGLLATLGASGAAKMAAIGVTTVGALGGVAATNPSLVDKARAAVERAALEAVSVDSGSSVERRGEDASGVKAGGVKASGFSPSSAAQGAPRQKTGPHEKAGRAQGRGGDGARKQKPGKGHAGGRGGDGPGSNGRGGKGAGPATPDRRGAGKGRDGGDRLPRPARGGGAAAPIPLPKPRDLPDRGKGRARGLDPGD